LEENQVELSIEDQRLLEDLCRQNGISYKKVQELLAVEQGFEFKERRTGIYEGLKEVLKTKSEN
jgi:hypothetical protein